VTGGLLRSYSPLPTRRNSIDGMRSESDLQQMSVGAGVHEAWAGVSFQLGGAHENWIAAEGCGFGAGGIRSGRPAGRSYREAAGGRRIASMECGVEVSGIGSGVRGRGSGVDDAWARAYSSRWVGRWRLLVSVGSGAVAASICMVELGGLGCRGEEEGGTWTPGRVGTGCCCRCGAE